LVLAAAILIAYFLGSIPTAAIVGRILGVDVRREGSCNPGASNLARLSGKRSWGAFVLLMDASKGFIPARFGAALIALFDGSSAGFDDVTIRVILGSAAILGHVLSVFLAFRGGKGVATSLGVVLALAPIIGLICFFIWAVLAELTRRISISSLGAGLIFPLILLFRSDTPACVRWFSWLLPIFLLLTHRRNLIRLARGEEPAISEERLVRNLLVSKKKSGS
jgi:glycerol-3-phosphate acyltransferase PlsY